MGCRCEYSSLFVPRCGASTDSISLASMVQEALSCNCLYFDPMVGRYGLLSCPVPVGTQQYSHKQFRDPGLPK